mmetsp:Transcript_42872/g.84223  ORF Transcript_42872/g.84223 Transcript_42872/m.84223 type:complete len:855 (+) Transcript_42872:237-2801(+)|eukprot:CAMPEP_0194315406 /NCGR_PEP_ID=MMETSP0171-20130528/12221_1 /TAXON_ID=218684 /ORGANISM="Corethron pennatum, Strain L29A3" /LENGTH=854 /DNA_ID=CAMNT_0039071219 /DNA_START=191 /DNA_END=2755 /DNA_ORIENTATION=+
MGNPNDVLDAVTIATGVATAMNGGALAFKMWRSKRSTKDTPSLRRVQSENFVLHKPYKPPFLLRFGFGLGLDGAGPKRIPRSKSRRATYSGKIVVPPRRNSLDGPPGTPLAKIGGEGEDEMAGSDTEMEGYSTPSGVIAGSSDTKRQLSNSAARALQRPPSTFEVMGKDPRVSNDDQSSVLTPDTNIECADGEEKRRHNGPLHESPARSDEMPAEFKLKLEQMQDRVNDLEREMDPTISLEKRLSVIENTWANRAQLVNDILKVPNKLGTTLDVGGIHIDEANPALVERMKYMTPMAVPPSQTAEHCNKQIAMGRQFIELNEKFRILEEENRAMKKTNASLESELTESKAEVDILYDQQHELQEECRDLNDDFNMLKGKDKVGRDAVFQLESLMQEHAATLGQLNAVNTELAETKNNLTTSMKADQKRWEEEKSSLKFELSVLKEKGRISESTDKNSESNEKRDNEVATLRARIADYTLRISRLELQLQQGEDSRRTMHNTLQALRGNIRVFVRARPILPNDGTSVKTSVSVLPNGQSLSIVDREKIETSFSFDKIFPPSAGQDKVFEEVSGFVQSAIDGYNVCLFSYGQTGSGKTHTMQGSGKNEMRGIIPRSVELILSQAAILQAQKWKLKIEASFLEIYNENLIDLLLKRRASTLETKLTIKRDSKGKSFVNGLTRIQINTTDKKEGLVQLEDVINTAASTRSVAKTDMNSESSRSHSIFILHIQGYHAETKTYINGSLNLCDLAGSERLDRSGAGRNLLRLKETQAINKSLSCLGDVFNALGKGSAHVPYRNSKLTYLLQDCFSGDGKALMFVNLSPTVDSCHESLCSLKFAQRVNKVELGKPARQVRQT